jgi:hypothetical protein
MDMENRLAGDLAAVNADVVAIGLVCFIKELFALK